MRTDGTGHKRVDQSLKISFQIMLCPSLDTTAPFQDIHVFTCQMHRGYRKNIANIKHLQCELPMSFYILFLIEIESRGVEEHGARWPSI